MDELEKEINKIVDENKDLIQLQEEKDALLPKTCVECKKVLRGEESRKELFQDMDDDEYITMMSIVPESIGYVERTCGYCLKHQEHKLPSQK